MLEPLLTWKRVAIERVAVAINHQKGPVSTAPVDDETSQVLHKSQCTVARTSLSNILNALGKPNGSINELDMTAIKAHGADVSRSSEPSRPSAT